MLFGVVYSLYHVNTYCQAPEIVVQERKVKKTEVLLLMFLYLGDLIYMF